MFILFRTTAWDALPALGGVLHVALIVGTCVGFTVLPWWLLAPAFCLLALLICWNLQCVSHNFIHNPFFASRWLNRVYSVLESFAIGVPHVCYHHYHLNHHFGDNDAPGPDGTTKDWSSTYRHGAHGRPEGFWRYVLLSFWRVEMGPLFAVIRRHGAKEMAQGAVESLALGLFWAALAWVNWQYFVFYYLTSYYLGWMLSYAQGYQEHHGTKPGDPLANAVSSYHRLYNLLWFNNGYHQEHHWDPKWHWTRMAELHEQLRPDLAAHGTRIIGGPHLTSLLEDWLSGRPPAPVRTHLAGELARREAA